MALAPWVSAERQIFEGDYPADLQAVGRLLVPSQRGDQHFIEYCTATVVTGAPSKTVRYLLSAWHCLENYRNTGLPIRFESNLGDFYQVYPLLDGGSMAADWVLLTFGEARSLPALRLANHQNATTDSPVLLAGYSRDAGLGGGGDNMTFTENCPLLDMDSGQQVVAASAYKGASGGPVLRNGEIVGVISRGDNQRRVFFVPLSQFGEQVRRRL